MPKPLRETRRDHFVPNPLWERCINKVGTVNVTDLSSSQARGSPEIPARPSRRKCPWPIGVTRRAAHPWRRNTPTGYKSGAVVRPGAPFSLAHSHRRSRGAQECLDASHDTLAGPAKCKSRRFWECLERPFRVRVAFFAEFDSSVERDCGDFRGTIEPGVYTNRSDSTSCVKLSISNPVQTHVIDFSPRREYQSAPRSAAAPDRRDCALKAEGPQENAEQDLK